MLVGDIDILGPCCLAITITILVMLVMRPVAVVAGLVDRPGGRKLHRGVVPVIGGVAIYGGSTFGLAGLAGPLGDKSYFLMASGLLMLVGVVDDRFHLSPWVRLIAHVCAGLFMTQAAGIAVSSLGAVFGSQALELGPWSVLFTLFVVASSVNAYNMVDGLDGLAGALACCALGSFAVGALIAGHSAGAAGSIVLVASIAGFLLFNLPLGFNRGIRTFMGDAGSTFLGFSVAWYGIKLTQGVTAVMTPVTVLWVTAVPLMELGTSFVRRISAGKSPFSADADHFHHILHRSGLTVRATFATLVVLQALFSAIGLTLLLAGIGDGTSLILLTGSTALATLGLYRAPAIVQSLQAHAWRRIRDANDIPSDNRVRNEG